MAENKYHFERLTPIDNMDLDVYEEAIDYVFKAIPHRKVGAILPEVI